MAADRLRLALDRASPRLGEHTDEVLSELGPDDPRWVAAITPTAHREIHYGERGDELNRKLQERLKSIEKP